MVDRRKGQAMMHTKAAENMGILRLGARGRAVAAILFLAALCLPAWPAPPTVVETAFPAREAAALRIVILRTEGGAEPCIDELEVYGPGGGDNLALASTGSVATASSCLPGYAAHAIEHLNDGQYGNARSWIAAERLRAWVQVDFPAPVTVDRVVFSRDREGHYRDRRIARFEVHLLDTGGNWTRVRDEELFYADPEAIPPPAPAPALPEPVTLDTGGVDPTLLEAFLYEEYAWLKAFGRADFDPGLSAPRYKMERPGPRHVGDDTLPLPVLAAPPVLDGRLDDPAWDGASRGAVRVASLDGFAHAPLVEQSVFAGLHEGFICLAVRVDRLLSSHVAVVSAGDWQGCGVVRLAETGLVFETYAAGAVQRSMIVEGAFDDSRTVFEFRLPLDQFPGATRNGLRVGLGLGGKFTPKQGRPVHFTPAPVSVAEQAADCHGMFRVRLAAAEPLTVRTNAPGRASEIHLETGAPVVVDIPAESGPIGGEFRLEMNGPGDNSWTLHLFRYDPGGRALDLADDMAARLDEAGTPVPEAQARLRQLREAQRACPDPRAPEARKLLLDARLVKRDLLFRAPALAPLARVLFVKRHPFNPSHNYSVLLDGHWRPGGAVCVLETPIANGRLEPERARAVPLFDAGEGVARTPMADFGCANVYFAYRPVKDGYYHLHRLNVATREVTRLTGGPFHDYWPCPLPDGGLAFISTRCKRRFLCWRPQAAVLFRMDADGENMRALSFANLTEWAPSVMDDGRIIWTRSEYQDKAADFGHTLWAIRPDGTQPELVFGNTITVTNGYANGRYVPGTDEVACTLISHFGDLNGPIVLADTSRGRFNPDAIASITPEVHWPGSPPLDECFRDPAPVSRDYILCSHATRERFDLYVIDRHGNREVLHADPHISCLTPTLFQPRTPPPVLPGAVETGGDGGEFILRDVYEGLGPEVGRGEVAWLAVSAEAAHDLDLLADGSYRDDHEPFQHYYASPSDVLTGPHGWPAYVVKESLGVVPVEEDGSAWFKAPSGKVLYFHVLDRDFNELQRMRSVVQLQPGERRSCTGCHENRQTTSVHGALPDALRRGPGELAPPPWGAGPFSFEQAVQPVLDKHCAECHGPDHPAGLDFSGTLDAHKIPASYRTLISKGLVHYADWTWSNPDSCHLVPPRSLGTLLSPLWDTLGAGHHDVRLPESEMRAIKTWIDLNCPLWPDYVLREDRQPAPANRAWLHALRATKAEPDKRD